MVSFFNAHWQNLLYAHWQNDAICCCMFAGGLKFLMNSYYIAYMANYAHVYMTNHCIVIFHLENSHLCITRVRIAE